MATTGDVVADIMCKQANRMRGMRGYVRTVDRVFLRLLIPFYQKKLQEFQARRRSPQRDPAYTISSTDDGRSDPRIRARRSRTRRRVLASLPQGRNRAKTLLLLNSPASTGCTAASSTRITSSSPTLPPTTGRLPPPPSQPRSHPAPPPPSPTSLLSILPPTTTG